MQNLTDSRRRMIAQVILSIDLIVFSAWSYSIVREILSMLAAGSGGIAGIGGRTSDLVLTAVGPIVSIVVARATGTPLARWWRNTHLLLTLAFILVPMTMVSGAWSNIYVFILSIALFTPVQVFFIIGAIAVWIASPPRQPPPRPR